MWVIVDQLNKMAQFIPTNKNVKTLELERLFVEHIYRLYGLPIDIVTNQDSKFNSLLWRAIFMSLETTLNISIAYHPKTNGQSERVN